MIPRTADGVADYLRSRRAQAAQARRQAEHHRRAAETWDAQAAEFEADIAHVEAVPALPATDDLAAVKAGEDERTCA